MILNFISLKRKEKKRREKKRKGEKKRRKKKKRNTYINCILSYAYFVKLERFYNLSLDGNIIHPLTKQNKAKIKK